MEPFLLIALVLGFGLRAEVAGPLMPPSELLDRLRDATALLVGQVGVVLTIGAFLSRRAAHPRSNVYTVRRMLARYGHALGIMTTGVYAYLILVVDWPGVVERGFGLRDWILVDDVAIIAPFLLVRVLTWWCLYSAERRVQLRGSTPGRRLVDTGRYVIRKARQSLGLILPAILVYSLLCDVAARVWPDAMRSPLAPIGGMLLMGVLVLGLAPALVRLAWPTRPLPDGPLRDRLERLAGRLGFRYTDILVWETHGAFVNAGVTGALPWYRYVLLTDTLIDGLDEREVEAVFGHEVGHIAHRHLAAFGLFFVGSLGVMALIGDGVSHLSLGLWLGSSGWGGTATSWGVTAVETLVLLSCLAAYLILVFGFLSRRFERQADIFGCRAVSCDRPDCPPHRDLGSSPSGPSSPSTHLCPVGIRIFANALTNVATLNGIEPRRRSWRHGSIAQRVSFLEALEGRPERERRFQVGVRTLRLVMAAGLLASLAVALWTGALARI